MNKLKYAFIISALTAATALTTLAGPSPHETVKANIGGNAISLTYGRPFSKKPGTDTVRVIWGTLVPWEKAWRLGADKSTTLVTEKAIVIGGITLPAGTNRLYMIPSEKGTSKLAINKKVGVWGIKQDQTVDEEGDIARVDLKKSDLDTQLDQLTIAIEPAGAGGVIKIQWEKTQYSIEFSNAPAATP